VWTVCEEVHRENTIEEECASETQTVESSSEALTEHVNDSASIAASCTASQQDST